MKLDSNKYVPFETLNDLRDYKIHIGDVIQLRPLDAPDIQDVQGGNELPGLRGELIDRGGGEGLALHAALHQTVRDELLQLLAQYLFRQRDDLQRLVEMNGAVGIDLMQDGHFPFAAQTVQGVMVGVGGQRKILSGHWGSLHSPRDKSAHTIRILSLQQLYMIVWKKGSRN